MPPWAASVGGGRLEGEFRAYQGARCALRTGQRGDSSRIGPDAERQESCPTAGEMPPPWAASMWHNWLILWISDDGTASAYLMMRVSGPLEFSRGPVTDRPAQGERADEVRPCSGTPGTT